MQSIFMSLSGSSISVAAIPNYLWPKPSANLSCRSPCTLIITFHLKRENWKQLCFCVVLYSTIPLVFQHPGMVKAVWEVSNLFVPRLLPRNSFFFMTINTDLLCRGLSLGQVAQGSRWYANTQRQRWRFKPPQGKGGNELSPWIQSQFAHNRKHPTIFPAWQFVCTRR